MTQKLNNWVQTAARSSAFAMLVMTGCTGAEGGDGAEPAASQSAQLALSSGSKQCGSGTLLNPETGACAAVHGSKDAARANHEFRGGLPPNLADKRRERAERNSTKRTNVAAAKSDMPVPGGLGAGVTYQTGQLSALDSAALYTHMVVYPEGIGELPDWLFTTATNRTEKGVEVVGIYLSGQGSIGVFDWSCSASDPCVDDITSPSWIWTRPFAENSCHYAQQVDGAGFEHAAMYYTNFTQLVGGRWQNTVTFWNYCTQGWDIVYSHEYGGTQVNCSATGSCGWWGPIIENFFDLSGATPVPELGFFDTVLVHDGQISHLPPSETSWSSPPSNWKLCYNIPNTSWSTTNQNCAGQSSQLELQTTVLSDWNTGYCMSVTVANQGDTGVDTWAVELVPNQSTLANTWSANFQQQANSNYRVTPMVWNSWIAAHGNVMFGFCANKTGAGYLPSLSVIQ